MPKSQIGYNDFDKRCCTPSYGNAPVRLDLTQRSLLFSPPPRKVSFEDRKINSSSSLCGDASILRNNDKKELGRETVVKIAVQSPGRKRPLLVRPTTTLSLVDLVKSSTQDSGNLTIEQSEFHRLEETKSKNTCSFNLSPHCVVHTTDLSDESQQNIFLQPEAEGRSKLIRPSPWGHFIDMAPDEETHNDLTKRNPNHDSIMDSNRRRIESYSCKEAPCRANRRLSPYGKYKTYARQGQLSLSFNRLRSASNLKGDFRLRPRRKNENHESAEELIGVFSELQVQHAQQSTI